MDQAEKDVPCAFCGHTVIGVRFVACAQCDVPVHADCWNVGGKCPAYACGSTRGLDPAVALYRKAHSAVVVPGFDEKLPSLVERPDAVAERIRLLEKHISVMSVGAAKQFGLMISGIAVLIGLLIAWPNGLFAYLVPPILVLWTGAIAIKSGPETSRHRVLQKKLDDLRSRQIEQQLDQEIKTETEER